MTKCSLCKKEIRKAGEHLLSNCPGYKAIKEKYPTLSIESYTASLKETRYQCPDCREVLKELVPNEYFLCEKCDVQFARAELSDYSFS